MPANTLRNLWVCLLLTHAMTTHAQTSLLPMSSKLAQKFTTQDTLFAKPYVDVDEWRDKPVRHRYVHGGFQGTGARFSLYFPPKERYQGRFFQYITPFPDNENLSQGASGEEDKIGFALTHGSYFIETNGGGRVDFAKPESADPTLGAFRVNAATAQFSRVIATQIYGGKRPYGYAFGGSGGAYRTVGSIENTNGVWDGVVPYVLGSPMAIPNVFTVRMHAMRILKDKFPGIIDALEPGGSGDMYAGLNEEEKAALSEVTKMGFPPKAWFGYQRMGIHGFLVLYQGVVRADKSYFEKDFWNTPGYLGANPPASLAKARIQQPSQIKSGIAIDEAVSLGLTQAMSPTERGTADAAWKAIGGVDKAMPVAFQLTDVLPDIYFLGGDFLILIGAGAGNDGHGMRRRLDCDPNCFGPLVARQRGRLACLAADHQAGDAAVYLPAHERCQGISVKRTIVERRYEIAVSAACERSLKRALHGHSRGLIDGAAIRRATHPGSVRNRWMRLTAAMTASVAATIQKRRSDFAGCPSSSGNFRAARRVATKRASSCLAWISRVESDGREWCG